MLNYTSLFADLEELFRSAGQDPASFRRLAREVERVRDNPDDYYTEVATDYVIRLEERVSEAGAQLSPEEITLLRAYLGLAPQDPEREQRLVDDLARLEDDLRTVLKLKDQPLNLKNLDGLRRLLDRMEDVLPRITRTLHKRQLAAAFDAAVSEDGAVLSPDWLSRAIRHALEGSDTATHLTSSEESASWGGA